MGRNIHVSTDELDKIRTDSLKLEDWYSHLQSDFQVTYRDELAEMVSGVSNRQLPIHRWFNLKEAFSATLPVWVIDYLRNIHHKKIERVIDPFIGGGTTGVALAQQGIAVDGVEYNPFIHFVATTKSLCTAIVPDEIREAIDGIDLGEPSKHIDIPPLSTFANPEYFDCRDLQVMLSAIEQVRIRLEGNDVARQFLLLGIAAALEDIANLRKDGRALRYSPKPSRPPVDIAIQGRWRDMLYDLNAVQFSAPFRVYSGTAVDMGSFFTPETFDLALYSPPYLNNFDYSEIYKLELWLLGFIKSVEEWRELRKSTIRSHPSITFDATYRLEQTQNTHDIATRLKEMEESICLADERTRREMKGVITGYFDDMYLALCEQWHVLKSGGFLVYIVANSRHKWLPVATDVILAEIARRIGFEPIELIVFKRRNGRTRQKNYLRETATIMRKP